jgi:hypothetical protein
MVVLEVKDSIQKGNEHFLLVLVTEDFAKSDVVLYVCEFHVKQFDAKIQKPPGFAAALWLSRTKLGYCFIFEPV